MVHAIALKRMRERAQHVFLPGHFGKTVWPPFTSQCGISGHAIPKSLKEKREVIRTSLNFGTRPSRYRCSLPGLTGFTVSRREGTGADHRGPVAERVGFEPTNTREDVTGIPVQRLRPLGHLSIQCVTGIS